MYSLVYTPRLFQKINSKTVREQHCQFCYSIGSKFDKHQWYSYQTLYNAWSQKKENKTFKIEMNLPSSQRQA
jgi:hypothetical protein